MRRGLLSLEKSCEVVSISFVRLILKAELDFACDDQDEHCNVWCCVVWAQSTAADMC